jgi:predicted transposase/invertase (TIGR01784 family)
MAYARQEAIEEGLVEGRAEGRAESRAEVARGMLADGMPVDKIAKYTNLSIEEIEALKA